MGRLPVFEALERYLHPKGTKSPVSVSDRQFLERSREVVGQNEAEPEFITAVAASVLGMSRMHLNRKSRALTGQSTHGYIQGVHLDEARVLLLQRLPVAYIARSCGFKRGSHFARVFHERFGTSPPGVRAKQSLARQPTRRRPWEKRCVPTILATLLRDSISSIHLLKGYCHEDSVVCSRANGDARVWVVGVYG